MTDTKDNQTIDIEEAITIETHRANTVEVQQKYGDNLPYQRDRVIGEVRVIIDQTASGMLQIGKRLVLLKENEPHGEFIQIVEGDFGITGRTAQLMMQAAIKYLNMDQSKTKALSYLGKSKLFDLMSQDTEDLEALAEGGTVAGLTLNEMDTMTTRELKEALKKARGDLKEVQEDNAAVREVSRKKDEKISEMHEKLTKKEQKDKKLKLKETDDVVTLTNAFTDQYKEVTTKLASAIYQLEQINVEAEKENLPHRFFAEFALAVSHERDRIQSLLEVLPDHIAPMNTSWITDAVIEE